MKPVRMLCAAILALTGLVAVGVTTEAATAASSKDLTVNHSKVMKSEQFLASGQLSTHISRPIKLQYRPHTYGSWSTKLTTSTGSDGSFLFFPSTTKSGYWRYYAPTSGPNPTIKGYSRKVSVVSQKVVSIEVVRQTQCHFFSNPTSDVTVVVDFYPARVGRAVNFGSSAVDTVDYQDAGGKVAFRFNPGTSDGTFDAAAVAQGYQGASSLATPVIHYSITQCPLIF